MTFEDRIYCIIGKQIRNERKKAKFTQLKLAEQVNLTRTSITNIEKGQQKIQVHTLYAIAKALNIPIGNLLNKIEQEEKSLEERIPQDLPDDTRKWVLKIINSTVNEQVKVNQNENEAKERNSASG